MDAPLMTKITKLLSFRSPPGSTRILLSVHCQIWGKFLVTVQPLSKLLPNSFHTVTFLWTSNQTWTKFYDSKFTLCVFYTNWVYSRYRWIGVPFWDSLMRQICLFMDQKTNIEGSTLKSRRKHKYQSENKTYLDYLPWAESNIALKSRDK